MIVRKAYRFRLEPNGEQRRDLARFAGSTRWVWNQALAQQKQRLAAGTPAAGYAEMCRWLTVWRHDPATAWLAEVHSQPLQQQLKDLDRALRDTFRPAGDAARKGFPRFSKKGEGDSFRYPQSVQAEVRADGWGYIRLPKIGWVRFRASRPVQGDMAQATVVREGDHWFVSIQTEQSVADPAPNKHDPVGVDLGVVRFATISDGAVYEPLNVFKRRQRQLARAQQNLARRQQGSANRRKQKQRVARLYRRVAAARLDYLHKASTTIAQNHGVVVLEDLKVTNMSRSARGTKENPGRHVQAKAGLNRAILDQGWYTFRQLLGYKLAERGGQLLLVNPSYTSQTCSTCGHVAAANRPEQARFACGQCGYTEHADLNAARNILKAAGYAVSACGGLGHQPPYEAGTRQEVV